MAPLRGSPYLSALQRDSEDAELQLNPLAGNQDLNKGSARGRGLEAQELMRAEASGSRYSILDGDSGGG
ncbi:hypothetical protein Dimus_021592 [Dionaea muscipula]